MTVTNLSVEMFYSGIWNVITTDVRTEDIIDITRGRPDESQRVVPTTFGLSLNNKDGKYSPRNPRSPLFGLIGRNTPVRVKVDGDIRAVGEVESFPPRWTVDGRNVWVPITVSGILRRINAPGTTRPAISALRRAVMAASSPAPVAYWPLEEDKGAAVPMPYKGLGEPGIVDYAPAYQPGQENGPTGTLTVYGTTARVALGSTGPRFGRGLTLRVPPHAAGVEIVTMHVRWKPFDSPKVLDGATFADLNHRVEFTGGGIRGMRIYFQSTTSSSTTVSIFFWGPFFDLLGTPDNLSSSIKLTDGDWHEIQVRMVQNGAQIDTQLWADGTLAASSTIAATTLGIVREVVLGASASYDSGLVIGQLLEGVYEASHVSVHNDNSVGQFYQAMIGHIGEKAADRIARLCAQAGIPVTIVGTAAESEQMGMQRILPTLELLQEAEDADGGILYEPRAVLGLAYRVHSSLYNQTPAITLNYAAGGELAPDLEPIEDTDVTANDVTVTNPDGYTSTAVREDGPLNVQEPPDGVGRYPKEFKLNLYAVPTVLQAAAWLLHLFTWDESRYPVVNLDLNAMALDGKTSLITAAASLDVGGRLAITNPPAWLPPDSIEVHAQGFKETLGPRRRTIEVNATPAGPYDVYRLATDVATNRSRIPTGGSTLNESPSSGQTTIGVDSARTPWIDSANYGAQFPFDIMVAGERMRVTEVRNYLNANPYFESPLGATNWTGQNGATIAASAAQFHQGAQSLLITPNGVSAAPQVTSEEMAAFAGRSYILSGWIRSTNAATRKLGIFWYNSSHVLLSASEISIALAAGVWTQFGPTSFSAPASTAFMRIFTNDPGTPAAGNTWYLDEATVTSLNFQKLIVTRSINGISKSHVFGTPIQLFRPPSIAR